jgi:hypothetical protein
MYKPIGILLLLNLEKKTEKSCKPAVVSWPFFNTTYVKSKSEGKYVNEHD